MTASMTFSTKVGGRPYDLISVMSFLFKDSKACEEQNSVCLKCEDETTENKRCFILNIFEFQHKKRWHMHTVNIAPDTELFFFSTKP